MLNEHYLARLSEASSLARRARRVYGPQTQDYMIMEECGELISALNRYARGRTSYASVTEEVADVLLTTIGLADGEVFAALERKMKRLRKALDEAEGKDERR